MSPKTRRLLLALSLLLVLAAAGTWWLALPKRTVERFVALASRGEFEQADALLAAESDRLRIERIE